MILVISSCSERLADEGGLFTFDGRRVERIDPFPSRGIATDGTLFHRILARGDDGAELLSSDHRGITRYLRVDGVSKPHDLLVDPSEQLLCVAAKNDRIVRFEADGSFTNVWTVPSERYHDWNLNCLAIHQERLYATAIGRFNVVRGSVPKGKTGVLFEVETGRDICTGLSSPHSPRFVDGGWLICNSDEKEVLGIDAAGVIVRRIDVGGYARGLCVRDDCFVVGASRDRYGTASSGGAELVFIDRATFRVTHREPFPANEIYEIIEVPERLIPGLRAGFRDIGSQRERVMAQYAMFESVGITPLRIWAVSDPLPPQACRIEVRASVPDSMQAGTASDVLVTVRNLGGAFLVDAPPYPVNLCYRWFRGGEAIGAGTWIHTRLPKTIPPGGSLEITATIAAPLEVGTFELRITLLQNNVAWFDDVDPANNYRTSVQVKTRS